MEIENRKLDKEIHYLDLVTYVPYEAKGNAGHPKCEPGVIINIDEKKVMVLYR